MRPDLLPVVERRRVRVPANDTRYGRVGACAHCGVVPYLAEETILRRLEKGLKDNRLMIVSVAKEGEAEGTIIGALLPLFATLRMKGLALL